MKKILLSSMLIVSVLANAQNKLRINTVPAEPVQHFKKVKAANFRNTGSSLAHKTTNSNGSAWFNQLDFIELINPGVQVISAMHVFPDSAITLGYNSSNTPVNPYVHKVANYMDPSFMAQQTIITDKLATYTLDSIAIGYLYERNTGLANNTADSLIIQVIAENHSLDYTLGGNFPYQDIQFDFAAQELKSTMQVLKRISVGLTYADTCSGGVYKQIKVGTSGIAPQTNSKKIGCVVSFKPGYTYTLTDLLIGDGTNIANKNVFFVLSSEQNGAGTAPTIYGTPSDYTTDMNMSYFLSTDTRYNISTQGWNGYFIPTYAYTDPFPYESHDIGYKLTVAITGVKELEANGFALNQNVPNPFSKESTVNYQLANDANSVVFNVTDITGRVIYSEKVSSDKGSHSVKLGAYASGLYYYSLNVDGKVVSKKMIVE
ncbi:MAG: T9SS type A sorting domain-containing protein [Bacteroidetes bacterium]|nr:T9SS type A sorting domain-containing protein [Bacteroidota bacterium]